MKYSIIVPVYNVEQFLETCIESILHQNFIDFEIIAVNDGSTDGSKEILEDYLKKTERLKVIHQRNKGLGGARNTGIQTATGDYLLLLDSDDYLEMNALETLATYLDKYNLDILAFDCNKVDIEGNIIETISVIDYKEKYTPLTQKQFLFFEPTACTKVYKRTLFTQNKIRFPERLWYEDLATVFRLVPYAKRIGYLKESCYNYVQQPNSITHSVNTERMMEIIDSFNLEMDFYKNKGLFEEYYAELEWNCALHVLYYSAYRFLTCGYNKKQMLSLYKYSKTNFPNIEKNKYVLQKKESKNLMELVINKHFFRFYLHTGFIIKCVKFIKTIVPLKRWR